MGIDLGKTVCSLEGLDATGAVVYRKRLQRHRLLDFLEGLDPCIVAMEACGGAHHIGRFCLQHGHESRLMSPLYVRPYGNKNPLNFTLSEWQQAKRHGYDPREIKQFFRDAWERSDGLKGFRTALEDRGFHLAQGDRRGFVALDLQGKPYSISKWTGVRVKDLKAKLGDPTALPAVSKVEQNIRQRMADQVKTYIREVKSRHHEEMSPFVEARAAMIAAQRAERKHLKDKQDERWTQELKTRSDRLNKGLRGIFDRLTGKSAKIKQQNEREAVACAKRDQAQRDDLITAQINDRRDLQKSVRSVKAKHRQDRKLLAKTIADYLRRTPIDAEREKTASRSRKRSRGMDLSP
ncbi:hypothetical protein KMP13_10740 [Epibacterium ulvae]|uniref:hypothetical protein n=1 Tax=Epibacterium ulvae TaxID=1156985 RepID=UPI001BFC219B|nr:hypothetical protein [Epibacterium ulvae]MBT8154365.1 hypothetical protein [Epibacterium ulvae]